MQNIVSLQTSGASCSVCLHMDGTSFLRTEHVERRHNERLLSMLAEVCSQAGIAPGQLARQLRGIAFGCGPGSFTGVRIAAAAAQALALAGNTVVVPVSSSAALAFAAASATSSPGLRGVVTLIRSRQSLYYIAAYRLQDGRPHREKADELVSQAPDPQWLAAYGDWWCCGVEPDWWAGTLPMLPPVEVTAAHVGALAQSALAAGEGLDPALALPVYVGGDSPWHPASANA